MKKITVWIVVLTLLILGFFVLNSVIRTDDLDDFIAGFVEETNKGNLSSNIEALLPYFFDEDALTKAVINRTINITNYTCQDSNLSNKYNEYSFHKEGDTVVFEVNCGTNTKSSLIDIVKINGQYKIKSISLRE